MRLIKLKLVMLVIVVISSCSNNDDIITENESTLTEVELLQKEIKALKEKLQNFEEEENKLTANIELTKNFYQEFFGDLNFPSIHKYIGDVYIQHNPYLADGKQALIDGATYWFEGESPSQIDFQRVVAQDDLVFVHIKSADGQTSTIDIFRIDNNLLVEHWDVSQDIPEDSVSDHPMF